VSEPVAATPPLSAGDPESPAPPAQIRRQVPDDVRPGVWAGVWAILAGGLRAACMLLTRLPVGARPVAREGLRWAAGFIPLVALGLGLLGALLLGALAPLGPRLAAAATIGLMLLVTGALHEDGLADTADALGGGHTRERLFAILKDSRLGTFGVLALVVTLSMRIEALAELGPRGPAAFAAAAVLSRAPLVWLMGALPYVTPADAARSADLVAVRPRVVALASAITLAAMAAAALKGPLSGWLLAGALGSAALVALLGGWYFRRRAGGITGDFLGATQQAGELAVLLTLLAAG
jgi:adenosylcobinamide-GDP ribazoletransferase